MGLLLVSVGFASLAGDLAARLGLAALRVGVLAQVPPFLPGLVFTAAGIGLCLVAITWLYRGLEDVLHSASPGRASLLELIYDFRLRQSGPKVVCIGGGTGMPSVLRGLKRHTVNITAIVTVGDDGGSSGRLRREHGILPPGDFRNNIVALADVEPLMARLFQHRFSSGTTLEGHSFGNLFVLAMTDITGSFDRALRETSRVLAVQGTILPSTLEDVTVCASFTDGTEVCGESDVPEARKTIDHIFLRPGHPTAQPEAVKAILDADLVVLGPGSLYTSVIPNLLVDGIAKALVESDALKVYVCNVATQPGETDGYDVAAHVAALARHLPGGRNPLDCVLTNRAGGAEEVLAPGVTLVRDGAPTDKEGPITIREDVARDNQPLRHDPEKLGAALMRVYAERAKLRRTRAGEATTARR